MGDKSDTDQQAAATTGLRDRIVDTALQLAEGSSWEAVRLHEIAFMLDISLESIRQVFREKDEIIDAWFDRADQAALQATRTPEARALPSAGRMHQAIMAWLDFLGSHRRVTREMIGAKAEFGHIHIQIPALIRISRTVQWFREAAGCKATLPHRAFAEAAHTSIYLLAFGYWMRDESEGSKNTRRFLEQLLKRAEVISP